jgi:MFS family permease
VTDAATITGGWRELLGARYLRTSILLAGGVALYATNEFLTTSLLPNTIAEIGGSRLYAWVTTLYLVGSVIAATMVNPMLLRIGARSSYLTGLAVFGIASLVCAAAPTMHVLIAGRAPWCRRCGGSRRWSDPRRAACSRSSAFGDGRLLRWPC